MKSNVQVVPDTSGVIGALVSRLGAAHVLQDPEDLQFYSQDVHDVGVAPLAVLRPGSGEELSEAVRLATAAGLAVVPRGGGMSYTRGYVTDLPRYVCIDMGRLDRVLDLNVADGFVTVECGITWRQLNAVLEPHGVRTPMWGTLSGMRATVGGGLSQGALFLGSGIHGPAAESLLGLDVVLADGGTARLGAHANANGAPFFRHFGPDLSAMFTGDCGALGIKLRATLRLIPRPAATRHLSFGFATAAGLFATLADVARAGIAAEAFAFDPGLQKVRMKRVSLAEDAKALGKVMKAAGGGIKALREGAKVVLAGRSFLDEAHFSAHFNVDERDAAEADARAALLRAIVGTRGVEVPGTIPQVMRANPFAEVTSMIGPAGERWVPVHGSVPLSRAAAVFEALEAVFARHRDARERHDIDHGYLVCTVGDRAILIEPVMYWPDSRERFHERVLDHEYLARLPAYSRNPEARSAVDLMRADLARCLMEQGAASFQLGRFYPYQAGLDPTAAALLQSVKQLVDPRGLMNPGCLGLAAPQTPPR